MTFENIYSAALVMIIFIVISYFINRALIKVSGHFDTSSSEVFRLLGNSQRAILIFCGIVLALSELGFNVSALVAGLGLTGFALGFALKDAISNLIAGVMIVIYKPVELGDDIAVKGTRGIVVDINLRYITIETGVSHHLVPNSLLLSNELAVFHPEPK